MQRRTLRNTNLTLKNVMLNFREMLKVELLTNAKLNFEKCEVELWEMQGKTFSLEWRLGKEKVCRQAVLLHNNMCEVECKEKYKVEL